MKKLQEKFHSVAEELNINTILEVHTNEEAKKHLILKMQ